MALIPAFAPGLIEAGRSCPLPPCPAVHHYGKRTSARRVWRTSGRVAVWLAADDAPGVAWRLVRGGGGFKAPLITFRKPPRFDRSALRSGGQTRSARAPCSY